MSAAPVVDIEQARLLIEAASAVFTLISDEALSPGVHRDQTFVAAYWGALELLRQGRQELAEPDE